MRNSCSLGIKTGVLRTRYDMCIGNATQSSSYHHRLCVCMMTFGKLDISLSLSMD